MTQSHMTRTETPYSSNIEYIAYEWKDHTLRVAFRSGGTYDYRGVPPEVYNEFKGAHSVGGYFHRNIKGKFTSSKVG